MCNIEHVLGIISSIMTIILFPLSLYQICKIKSNTKVAKDSIDKMQMINDCQMIKLSLDLLSKQHEKLNSVFIMINQKGITEKKINDELNEIINNNSQCIINIPNKYNSDQATNLIKKSNDSLREYISNKDSGEIKDSISFLFSSMIILKRLEKKYIQDEIDQISEKQV